jgi:hypothetical protein
MTATDGPLRIESLCDGEQSGVAARQSALPPGAQLLHRAVLRAFLNSGAAPHRTDLPAPAGIDLHEAWARLDEVDLVHLDADGRVIVAYPFSSQPTGHTVHLDDGPSLQAMCAIDALGIPLMAGRDGVIESADPLDGQPIRVERIGNTWRWAPAETAVLLAQSAGRGAAAECLCPAITFHSSRDRAEAHLQSRPELIGLVLGQDQALDIARSSFGPLLASDLDANGDLE